jgi:hypothetical protein
MRHLKDTRKASITATFAAILTMATLAVAGAASAGGNGPFTQTQNLHGIDVAALGVMGITPPPDTPASCPVHLPLALVPITGNAVQHLTVNGAGDGWFTTTFAGDVQLFAGQVIDDQGDVIAVGPLLYSGHLTTWFGAEDNNQNGVFHATLTFHGANADGSQSLSLHANFDVTTNANGPITATPTNVSCR